MTPPALAAGEILPLLRRLGEAPDPLALFAALTDQGTRDDVVLLESADARTGAGERSILLPRNALRITGRGLRVTLTPLTASGRTLLSWLEATLDPGLPRHRTGDTVEVRFPAPPPGPRTDRDRITAPSPLDVLRAAAFRPRLVSAPADLCPLVAGVLAYDLIDLVETLPPPRSDDLGFPDFEFWVPEQVVIIDHVRRTTSVLALVMGGDHTEAHYHDGMRSLAALTHTVETVARSTVSSEPPVTAPNTQHLLRPHQVSGLGYGELGPTPNPQHPTPTTPLTPAMTTPVEAGESADLSDDEYGALVRRLQTHIVAGDVFQIVASRSFRVPCPDPLAAYRVLRALNPSPYMFYVRGTAGTLFGASPETAVQVQGPAPHRVTIRPIAGTAARGRQEDGSPDADHDARLEAALRTDAKEMAEHMMLVDLARNDIARVSVPGTRQVTRLLTVERYSHVMHLVSEVTGTLAPGLDALHAYAASMNMGTLVGAPKVRAAELLREVEASRRGPYGGAVGYLTHDGNMDTAIIIRAAMVQNGVATVRAGAGVVLDSRPEREARETQQKAASVLRAIVLAQTTEMERTS